MHPLADRTCEPRPLVQDGRIRTASPVDAGNDSWVPVDGSITRQPAGVDRFAGQTETQDSRPYAPYQLTGRDGGLKGSVALPGRAGWREAVGMEPVVTATWSKSKDRPSRGTGSRLM